MNVYTKFAIEYRRIYRKCAEGAKLHLGSEQAVEFAVEDAVNAISAALDGKDVEVAYLALSHVLEHHFMEPMAGR